MSERETPAEAIYVEWFCDICDQSMTFTGYIQPMSLPLYGHECPQKHVAMLERVYPTTLFRKLSVFRQIAGL